jgi:hypothetical protein
MVATGSVGAGIICSLIGACMLGDALHGDWGALIGVLVFGGGGVALISEARRRRRARNALGARASIAPVEVRPGEDLEMTLELTPRRPGRLLSASVTVLGREVVQQGHGSGASTFNHVVFDKDVMLSNGAELRVSRTPLELAGRLSVPADAPPSFSAPSNELTWTVKFSASARFAGDETAAEWDEECVIHVLPS